MRLETLTESSPKDLELDLATARALAAAGRELAAQRQPTGDDPSAETSAIRCAMNPNGTWRVTVPDAIGIIRIGDLQLAVEPKIPREHLFYLFGKSNLFPRVDESEASAAAGQHLWQLVASWFIGALEAVMRRDLVRDYLPFYDMLAAARGQIDALPTARLYYAGRLEMACAYEEFGNDTPLNRTLKSAARAVSASPELDQQLRRRAARLASRMGEVSELQVGDLRAQIDRRTAHYRDALVFARSIITNTRRSVTHGGSRVWTFLIRTPDLVEDGVRRLVADELSGWSVAKESIELKGAPMTVRPDIVVGDGWAIADVKYKVAAELWSRPDLYELVAFAEAAGAEHAAIIGFRVPGSPVPPAVGIGERTLRFLSWDADPQMSPLESAMDLSYGIQEWLAQAHVPSL